jgi:hypothetical protein
MRVRPTDAGVDGNVRRGDQGGEERLGLARGLDPWRAPFLLASGLMRVFRSIIAIPMSAMSHTRERFALGGSLNRTTRHWYSVKLFENTLAVRSARSRTSGAVEEQAGRDSGGLRLHSATLRPNGKGSTASEKVYESFVV